MRRMSLGSHKIIEITSPDTTRSLSLSTLTITKTGPYAEGSYDILQIGSGGAEGRTPQQEDQLLYILNHEKFGFVEGEREACNIL